ncbi:MAG: TraB/GumN family protein [Anaerolineaceae bacterium]|nr:TraB/GumN family protein [Anaerolineaceae bacterium]MCB9101244.1 TraB/GumN family protein [Anaerolineales bacterium]
MEQVAPKARNYPQDVKIVNVKDREFIIIGTAHISQESADLVRRVIEAEQPDCVCVELDEQRYKTLSEARRWESLDIKEVIRQKQLITLLVNLVLASYQKKLGQELGVAPGTELLEATKVAKALDIPIALCDRDVRITLRRAWASMSFFEKFKFLVSGTVGVFDSPEISEEMLSELRQKDVLSELMKELGEAMPILKRVLLDERDVYIAQKTREAPGNKIVAVVGAGHAEGIVDALAQDVDRDLTEIETIPPASPVIKWIGWGIPAIILAAIAFIGIRHGLDAAGQNLMFWILANGIPSSIGAIIALAHPITIISAFIAAPITSLTPVIGAGYVTAFVQAYYQPPVVKEFQTIGEDINHFGRWWSNRLLRIFLVFILTSLGSMIGTYVGAYEIISNLFG